MNDLAPLLHGLQLAWELRWPLLVAAALATFPWWTTRPLRTFTGNVLELYNLRSVLVLGTVNLLATGSVIAAAWLSLSLCTVDADPRWAVALAAVGIPTPLAAAILVPRRPLRPRWLLRLGLLGWTAAAPLAGVWLARWLERDLRDLCRADTPHADFTLAHAALAGLGGAMLAATLLTAVLHAPNRVKQRAQVAAGAWLLSLVALAAALAPGIAYWAGHLGWLERLLARAGVRAHGLSALEPPVELLGLVTLLVATLALAKRHPATLRGEGAAPATDWTEHARAVAARLKDHQVAIVVSAQGGGIHSAAWTTRVLHGLHEQIPGFFDRVVLASGTSGGAVGIAWAVAGCAEGGAGRGLERAATAAAVGSLDAFGWGTVYLDGLGAAWERRRGRGWALEEDWRGIAREHGVPTPSLRALRECVNRGDLPVPVLNATVLETGGPMTLCPLGFPPIDDGTPLPSDWWEAGVGDVDWFSAARLASSYAWTTPMAHVAAARPFHLADGGYFDNTGVSSALRWLAAMEPALAQVERIVLLEIAPFDRPAAWRVRGRWYTEVVAPLVLLYRALFRGQRVANEARVGRADLQRLAVSYVRPPSVTPASIGGRLERTLARWVLGREGLDSEPLSWQLSEHQRELVDRAWERWWEVHGDEARRLLGG